MRTMHRFATPLTTGLFAICIVSGVALFFHWLPGAFHAMHVWFSMVLLIPFAFHVRRNWSSLIGYARRGTLAVPLLLSLMAAAPFAVRGLTSAGGGSPGNRAMSLLIKAPLSKLAPLLKSTPEDLLATLKGRGYQAGSIDETPEMVAAHSGTQPSQVMTALLPAR